VPAEIPTDPTSAAIKVGQLMGDVFESIHPGAGQLVPADRLDDLTELYMVAFAESIQAWIDAGSERDAVMENESLREQLHKELHSWSNDPALRG
jgi:hypothetical protein